MTDGLVGGHEAGTMPNVRRSGLLLTSLLVAACASPPVTSGFASDGEPSPPFELGPRPPDEPTAPPPPIAIDRDRELLFTSRAELSGARSDDTNASAPWSFRHLMEALAKASATDAPTFVRDWLATWQAASTGTAEGALPLGARVDVQRALVCPWLRLTPENACDESCTACASSKLDLSRAPFRLLAIVNRLDLAESPDGCKPEASEARFVFVALQPGTSTPLSFNAIFEYAVDGTTAGAPAAWHSLGALRDEAHAAALEVLTRSFTDGARLAQLRTSENLGGGSWELRQFARRSGKLVPTALTNTVPNELDGTPALVEHVNAHSTEIFAGDNAVPATLATAVSTMPSSDFRWSGDGASFNVLRLFGLSTCNGCHAGERGDTTVLPFAHVGVDASGATILSRFLSDPSSPGSDELAFRGRSLARRLSGQCGAPEASYGGRHGLGGGGLEVTPDRVMSARRSH